VRAHTRSHEVALLQTATTVLAPGRPAPADGLVLCGSNLVRGGGAICETLLRSQRRRQQRSVACSLPAVARESRSGSDRRIQAVLHRSSASAKASTANLRALPALRGAAADVLRFGLGAQVRIGDLGVARFQLGQAVSAATGASEVRGRRLLLMLSMVRSACRRSDSWRDGKRP